ncbi:MAG: glutathione S-transferase [Bermanella sp.]
MKLYGSPISNYCNVVKLAMLEKGVEFDTQLIDLNKTASIINKSPMGKIPCLETEHGFLSETSVILDYLEDTQGGISLYPRDSFERARVKQIIKIIELYIELPARSCYPQAFFGSVVSEPVKKQARSALIKGVKALNRLGQFSPYIAGKDLTYADLLFMYTLDLAAYVAKDVLGMELLADMPDALALMRTLNSRPHAEIVNNERDALMAEFLASIHKDAVVT